MNRALTDTVTRVVKQPVRTLAPVLMRRLGLQRPVQVALPGGGLFQGVLPAAITTSVWRGGVHDADTTALLRALLREGETFVDV